jgi:phage virion morphogenesis protein
MIIVESEHTVAVLEALNRLTYRTENLRPLLAAIGEDLTESTKHRFTTQLSPDGHRWKPNAFLTVRRKGPQYRPPLTGLTGHLQQTIHYLLESNDLYVGSPMEYARVQQEGGESHWREYNEIWDIPARPFLGISDSDAAQILLDVSDYLLAQ